MTIWPGDDGGEAVGDDGDDDESDERCGGGGGGDEVWCAAASIAMALFMLAMPYSSMMSCSPGSRRRLGSCDSTCVCGETPEMRSGASSRYDMPMPAVSKPGKSRSRTLRLPVRDGARPA